MVAVTKRSSLPILKALTLSVAAVFWSAGAVAADLPSWSDGPAKAAIVEFVEGVVTEGHGSFVPVVDRIAVFDNDGTLWSEQPVYFQFFFRSEEHTSELQSLMRISYAVFCLKKKKTTYTKPKHNIHTIN